MFSYKFALHIDFFIFLYIKPQEFKNMDKQTFFKFILGRQHMELCLVTCMTEYSPIASKITDNWVLTC